MSILLVLVVLRQTFVPGADDAHPALLGSILIGYALVSWALLYAFFEKVDRVQLGTLFLALDVVVWVVAIYLTGADRSWLFFLLFIRAADQANTSFRRVLWFAHLSVGLYTMLLFTERGGVAVRLDLQERTAAAAILHFSVSDTGIGIPLDRQAAVFEAFTQADGSTTRRYGGTGLGLTISSTLVQMMRGRIWLESHPGTGTTFHFTAAVGVAVPRAVAGRTLIGGQLRRVRFPLCVRVRL